jgi:hypothetical protein
MIQVKLIHNATQKRIPGFSSGTLSQFFRFSGKRFYFCFLTFSSKVILFFYILTTRKVHWPVKHPNNKYKFLSVWTLPKIKDLVNPHLKATLYSMLSFQGWWRQCTRSHHEAASTHCWRQRHSVTALAMYAMTLVTAWMPWQRNVDLLVPLTLKCNGLTLFQQSSPNNSTKQVNWDKLFDHQARYFLVLLKKVKNLPPHWIFWKSLMRNWDFVLCGLIALTRLRDMVPLPAEITTLLVEWYAVNGQLYQTPILLAYRYSVT